MTYQTRSTSFVVSGMAAMIAVAGCGAPTSTERAEPRHPVRTDKVDYNAPNPGATRIAVPEIETAVPNTPLPLVGVTALKPLELLEFRGTVRIPGVTGGLARVEFVGQDKKGQRVILQEVNQPVTLRPDGETMEYRLEVRAPRTPGKYDVDVSLMVPELNAAGKPEFRKVLLSRGSGAIE